MVGVSHSASYFSFLLYLCLNVHTLYLFFAVDVCVVVGYVAEQSALFFLNTLLRQCEVLEKK